MEHYGSTRKLMEANSSSLKPIGKNENKILNLVVSSYELYFQANDLLFKNFCERRAGCKENISFKSSSEFWKFSTINHKKFLDWHQIDRIGVFMHLMVVANILDILSTLCDGVDSF